LGWGGHLLLFLTPIAHPSPFKITHGASDIINDFIYYKINPVIPSEEVIYYVCFIGITA
jgi:hypothetical protein